MKKLNLLFISLFFTAVLFIPVFAQDIHYWEDTKHIKVYIPSGHEDAQLMKRAFNAWETSSRRRIKFTYVTNPQDAQDIIVFKDVFSDGSIGKTTIRPTNVSVCTAEEKGRKSKGECEKTRVQNVTVITMASLNPYTMKKIPKGQLYHTALHEIGHSLGLNHSTDPKDVMYPTTVNFSMTGITANDLKALDKIYGW